MKQWKTLFFISFALMMLVGCSDNTNGPTTNDEEENKTIVELTDEDTNEKNENTKENELDDLNSLDSDTVDNDPNHKTVENSEPAENNGALSSYSNEQIEYARIWLQLGPNQELEELSVRHIPAGEPLHPEDETSVGYPEDVIQLSGTRLVDGSVTYSGNGDGTINVYNVPLRWDGVYPAGEEFYQEIIDSTELVSVNTGDDQEVILLIKLLTH